MLGPSMTDSDRSLSGYRGTPGQGPHLRTDVIDVYIFRRSASDAGSRTAPRDAAGSSANTHENGPLAVDLLQLLRAGAPLDATWQPVMGHIEAGERAWQTARRELVEEVALHVEAPDCLGFWALEQVYPYYLADLDMIVASPRFACEVGPDWSPTLNHEHTDHRWVHAEPADAHAIASSFMWPGQQAAVREIMTAIAPHHAPAREHLRIDPAKLI